MTKFENSINRNIDRELFFNILEKKYGDGKNTWNYTYGDVSSWLTWVKDDQGKFQYSRSVGKGYGISFLDEHFDSWNVNDPNRKFWEKLPNLDEFLKKLTTDIIFVGLNMSGTGVPFNWPPFSNARNHRNIIKLLFNTAAEGAYFTDIIRPDKRFLDKIGKPSDSTEVIRIVNNNPAVLKEHFILFENELDFIRVKNTGAEKALLITFGNDTAKILEKGIGNGYLKKDYNVINIQHYSNASFDKIANDWNEKLKEFITIPNDIEILKKKCADHGIPWT
jgi:hypothetical protein